MSSREVMKQHAYEISFFVVPHFCSGFLFQLQVHSDARGGKFVFLPYRYFDRNTDKHRFQKTSTVSIEMPKIAENSVFLYSHKNICKIADFSVDPSPGIIAAMFVVVGEQRHVFVLGCLTFPCGLISV